ncbi:hypothetical protein LTR37_018939 [Vermiconidia calcicola]|uniref:Uncharacterized protein n=1 Tax=Vermiconidia calcicola TaxID=1690605 RepID=A0ACC3MFP9_9PEZI|nr:hypothetical protein LTR37_018939 [Vermiconidia calcicola]
MAPKEYVYVVYEKTEEGEINLVEAYPTNDAAKTAASALDSGAEVHKLELKSEAPKAAKGKAKSAPAPKAKAGKKQKSPDVMDDQDNDVEDDANENDEPEAPEPKKAAPKKAKGAKSTRTEIPEGKPNVLQGLKLLFTGTMSMDRKTAEATAKTYGGEVIAKLEDTDYIILGTRPGDKKEKTINEHGLETITESEFFDILKNGVPKEKRDRMAAKGGAAEPAKKKQKK